MCPSGPRLPPLSRDPVLTRRAPHLLRLLKNPLTTGEIKACLDDLKVLGKKDFKMLLKYRLAIREDVRRTCSLAPCPGALVV